MRGTRRGRQRPQKERGYGVDNYWTLMPRDHTYRHQQERAHEAADSKAPALLMMSSSPSQGSNFAQKSEKNCRHINYGSRKHRGRGAKLRYVEKSEANSSKSDMNYNRQAEPFSHEVDELNGEIDCFSIYEKQVIGGDYKGKQKAELKNGTTSNIDEVLEPEEVDVLSRLNALRLNLKVPELTEDELLINDQSQEDELLAMESIYGDNVLIMNKQYDLRYFQIHVMINVADTLTVTANLTSDEGSGNFSYSINVQHIPPIILTFLLPKSYPSHSPPFFTISVQWLNTERISSLCSVLDSIWMEQEGQEVLYRWTDWLQNSSLAYLGFDQNIILGPYGNMLSNDKRAISGSYSPDVDIPYIRRYNNEQCNENFLKSFHECCICLSEYSGVEFAILPCQHFFCWKCMRTYSSTHVFEGTVSKLQCPDSNCEGMIPPDMLKKMLGDEEFERWEALMLQKTLESMKDIVYCPRCETPCIEDDEQHAQCSKCFFSFCTLCRERRHVGITCVTPDIKLKILQERQSKSHLGEDQRRREREMINELISVKAILRDAKQCPSCRMAISRTEGCNKMVCNNCGQYFCYRCNKAITGYEHFRDGTCELFPTEMILEWEERVNPRQVYGQIQAQLYGQHGQLCPNCRQFNAKVGNNNHLFCWACQVHYCYLCKQIVRRSSQHYGPKGCKQHTEG